MLIDPLSDVLALLKPQTYVAGGFDLAGEWSIQFAAHTGVKCYAVLSGRCWLKLDGLATPVHLKERDCVLLPNGQSFRLASNPSLAPTRFEEMHSIDWRGGIATLNGGGEVSVLGGHFAFAGAHADMLLGAMPPIAHLREEDDKTNLRWALERMRHELADGQPGGVLVAQHLAHMMLVQALRIYLSGGAGRHVGWIFALADPQLSAAIAAIHAEPGASWSLGQLARVSGMSRSSFARSFQATVGTSPIDYLTRWRMLLASARLAEGVLSVSAIARSLGYGSESAFSTAFTRVMGSSPRAYAKAGHASGKSHPWPLTAVLRPSA